MNWFWRIFLKGLATILPIFITIYSLYWLGLTSELILGNTLKYFITDEHYWPGMGIIVAVSFVMLLGVLVDNRIGQFFVHLLQNLITRIPIANTIYNGVMDLMQFFSASRDKKGMDQVVEVDLGMGMRLVGFVTQKEVSVPLDTLPSEDLIGVYLPLSYQIGGYTVYLPRDRVKPVDMSVEQAMRLTLTAGISGEKRK